MRYQIATAGHKRWRNRLIPLVLAALIVVVGAAFLVLQKINGPVNGTVLNKTNGEEAADTPDDEVLASSYFITRYAGNYRLKAIPRDQSASLAAWQLLAKQSPGGGQATKITIVVDNLPPGGAKASSAYQLFASRPEVYELSQAKYNHEPVIVAKQSEPTYQQTVLWPHQSYLLSVTLTAGQETELTDQEIGIILTKLQWQ
jgi:hypothetical protein